MKLLERETTIKAVIAYADDLLLLVEGNNRTQLETKCCRAMAVVDSWSKAAKLKIPTQKTTFSLMKGCLTRDPLIKLGNDSINRSVTTKYLGVHLDEATNFITHAEHVCERGEGAMMKVARPGQGEIQESLLWSESSWE